MMPGRQPRRVEVAPLKAHLALPLLARELHAELNADFGYHVMLVDLIMNEVNATAPDVKHAADLVAAQKRILLRNAGRLVIAAMLIGQSMGYSPQDVLSAAAQVAAEFKKNARQDNRAAKKGGQGNATKQGS